MGSRLLETIASAAALAPEMVVMHATRCVMAALRKAFSSLKLTPMEDV